MIVRCECCKGRKKMIALGNIQKDCAACKGIGFITEPEPAGHSVTDSAMISDFQAKKRGRPRVENGRID